MAKTKRSLSLSKAEFSFDTEEGTVVIEHLKDEDKLHVLDDLLRRFEGCQNLTISISTEKEI